jgi:hypothetical protein
MNALAEQWNLFSRRPVPTRYEGCELNGVDLGMLHTLATGALAAVAESGACDRVNAEMLKVCREQLKSALPAMSGKPKAYYQALHDLIRLALRDADCALKKRPE